MPELPEVEILVRQVAPLLRGRTINRLLVHDPKIHLPRSIIGEKIVCVSRRGKFIVIQLTGNIHLLVHLRMTGWLELTPPARYRLAIVTDKGTMYFEDRRRLGQVRAVSARRLETILNALGPEPLARGFHLHRLQKTSRAVKVALMDQHIVAGIGNIYASESLWRARINPRRAANRLGGAQRSRLRRSIVVTLRKAIALGDRVFDSPDQFAVYGMAGECCLRCGQQIRRIVQVGRSTFFCPHCQR